MSQPSPYLKPVLRATSVSAAEPAPDVPRDVLQSPPPPPKRHAQDAFTPAEMAAAAAEARRTLQEPRYVAMAEEERRAAQLAEERRRAQRAAGEVPHMPDETLRAAPPSPPSPSRRGVVRRVEHGEEGDARVAPRRSVLTKDTGTLAHDEAKAEQPEPAPPRPLPGPPVLYLQPPASEAPQREKSAESERDGGGAKKAKRRRAAEATTPTSGKSTSSATRYDGKAAVTAEKPQKPSVPPPSETPAVSESLAVLAKRKVAQKAAAEAKALRASLASVKALLKQAGIASGVVPVLPLEKCAACDYCILFSDKKSVEDHLVHVARVLCATGMKVIYTLPPAATDAPSAAPEPHGSSGTAASVSPDGNHNGEAVADGEPEVKRRLRNMYCFLVEAVPVSGNAEVVALHVTLRPGMHDIFYKHYANHYNSAADAAAAVGDPGMAVDKPFPEDVALLTDAQKKRLLYLVLRHLVHEKAAVPLDTAAVTLFPAHVDAMRDRIWEDCIGRKPWHLWKLLRSTDEAALAAYFGEETMFYFAWMNHYQRWLAAASGCAVAAMALGYGVTEPTPTVAVLDAQTASSAALAAAKAVNGTLLNATAAAAAAAALLQRSGAAVRGADPHGGFVFGGDGGGGAAGFPSSVYALPLFLLILILGSVLCIKMWERRCSCLCMRFGLFQPSVNGKDEVRPEFRGWKGVNPITGAEERQFPGWIRGLVLQPLSWLIIAAFAAATIALMVCFVNLEGYTAVDGEAGEVGFAVVPALRRFSMPGCVFNKTDHPVFGLIPTILYSACISVLSMAFKVLAEKLTRMENYKFRGEHIRALTQKRIVFEFINSYAKLFFLAVVRHCITDLSTSLKVIFFTSVFTRLITDTAIPFVKTHRAQVARRLRQRRHGRDVAEAAAASPESSEKPPATDASLAEQPSGSHGGSSSSALDEYDERLDTYEVYTDYVEMAVQFGYIVLFAVAFPLAPLVAFLSNIIEVRSDLFKLCYVVRRPVPRLGLAENHTWVGVFRVMAIASVMTNMILFSVSGSPIIARLLPSCFAFRFETRFVEDTLRLTGTGGAVEVDATPLLVKGMGRYAVFNAVVVEHVVLAVAVFLFWRISAFPKRVSVHVERRQYKRMMAAATGARRSTG